MRRRPWGRGAPPFRPSGGRVGRGTACPLKPPTNPAGLVVALKTRTELSQSHAVSPAPEISRLPSALHPTSVTTSLWPAALDISAPVAAFRTRMSGSRELSAAGKPKMIRERASEYDVDATWE